MVYEKTSSLEPRDISSWKQRALVYRLADSLGRGENINLSAENEERFILFLRFKLGLCGTNATVLLEFMKSNNLLKSSNNALILLNKTEIEGTVRKWREMEPRENPGNDNNTIDFDRTDDLERTNLDKDKGNENGKNYNDLEDREVGEDADLEDVNDRYENSNFIRLNSVNVDTPDYGNTDDENDENNLDFTFAQDEINKSSFPCKECDEVFKTYSTWRIHYNFVHLGKQYPCDKCEYVASRTSHLKQHIRNVHAPKQIKCTLCKFTTTGESYLVKHMKSVHDLSEARYSCDKCEHVSKSQHSLRLHKRIKHLTGVRFQCDKCDYFSPLKYLLKEHKAIKHDGVRFQCDQCLYSATKMYNLKVHIQTKHEGVVRLLCDECDYTCNHSSHLKVHKKTKHNPAFPCDVCDFAGSTLYHLKKHKSSQHKQYSCNKCDFVSNRPHTLRKHREKDHSRPFQCEHCEFQAARLTYLRTHLEKVHGAIKD